MFAAASDFNVTTVQVQSRTGSGARGPVYADPTLIDCYVSDVRKLVRNGSGNEVVSSSALFSDPANAPVFALDSLVTINGRVTTVLSTTLAVIGDPDVDHVRVDLA
jgi:hypothetical protein